MSTKADFSSAKERKGFITVHFKAYQRPKWSKHTRTHGRTNSSSNTISTLKDMFLFLLIDSCYSGFIGYNKRFVTFLTWSCTNCRTFRWWLSTMHLTTTWLMKWKQETLEWMDEKQKQWVLLWIHAIRDHIWRYYPSRKDFLTNLTTNFLGLCLAYDPWCVWSSRNFLVKHALILVDVFHDSDYEQIFSVSEEEEDFRTFWRHIHYDYQFDLLYA